jgi:hypothetical protein
MPHMRTPAAAVHPGPYHGRTADRIKRALLAYQVGIWLLAICMSLTS